MLLLPPPPPDGRSEPPRDPAPAFGTGARIWLLRHAEVRADVSGIAYGDRDVPLSERGHRQTGELARATRGLAPACLASSPAARARALAAAIGLENGLEPRVDEDWNELHRGDWQGLAAAEYEARWAAERDAYWADPWRWRGHGGESEEQLAERAWRAFADLVGRAEGGCAIAATHRNVIRSIVATALGLGPARSHALQVDPARGVALLDAPEGWRLVRSNIARPDERAPRELA